MRSMQWQLGILGTISAFAYRHRETKKNLCRDGRSQDLPGTDFQPAVRHQKYKKKSNAHTHSTANTHKMTTIHTRQLQQYKQDNYNNTHKTTTTRRINQFSWPPVNFVVGEGGPRMLLLNVARCECRNCTANPR